MGSLVIKFGTTTPGLECKMFGVPPPCSNVNCLGCHPRARIKYGWGAILWGWYKNRLEYHAHGEFGWCALTLRVMRNGCDAPLVELN
jgi:hypothetical protein